MEQEEYHHNNGDQRLLNQRLSQCADSFIDELCAVVDTRDFDATKFGLECCGFLFHSLDDATRVLAVAHDNHTAYGFRSVVVECSATECRACLNCRNIGNRDRNIILQANDRLFDLRDRFAFGLSGTNEAATADDVFHTARLDCLGSDIDVCCFDRVNDATERQLVVAQFVRIDFDLILPHIPANRSHFCYAFHRLQRVFDVEVLLRP